LDDVLSALDKKTENMMTDRLFGNGGLFHTLGSTVIMVTHASKVIQSTLVSHSNKEQFNI
jgi:ATP-binding cassette subfamily C (CFTR/MRP) protein 1